jgi:hypothetical protein
MAVKIEEAPFIIDFGGFIIQQKGRWLCCEEKNVQIGISLLKTAMTEINKVPMGQKILVGVQIKGSEIAYMWRDDFNTHIGCLHEPTTLFNKKYQRLVKHLKQ